MAVRMSSSWAGRRTSQICTRRTKRWDSSSTDDSVSGVVAALIRRAGGHFSNSSLSSARCRAFGLFGNRKIRTIEEDRKRKEEKEREKRKIGEIKKDRKDKKKEGERRRERIEREAAEF